MEMLRMMQLADSALPLGGFAFSNGLEWMVKTGTISTLTDMEEYLKGMAHQASQFDLPFMKAFCRADEWEALEDYHAMLFMPAQRDFSITQGRAWLRLIPQLYEDFQPSELRKELRNRELPPHFLFVLVQTMKDRVRDLKSLALLYVYMLLRDQISAGLRLGIYGPAQSQQILSKTLSWAEETLADWETMDYNRASRVSVLQDIALAGHRGLYSKLFQN